MELWQNAESTTVIPPRYFKACGQMQTLIQSSDKD